MNSPIVTALLPVVLLIAVGWLAGRRGWIGGAGGRRIAATVGRALRNAILHPVVLPVIGGLSFAQTGWTLPEVIDKLLALLGQAFSPIALVLVGITLAQTPVGLHLRGATVQALVKNVAHPLGVRAIGTLLGVHGLPLAVMVVAASMLIGANVFMFAQRYRVAEELVTASVVVSTLLALATMSLALAGAARLAAG